ncbi:Spermine/spermidine synthase [Nitrosomonas aestuarii]|uniref:Spermine/spermidine synthase n=1 Tax=Nitrosomonas aestuarii TaxID=52441 RepID=A0A1I4DRI1_9PROT|nr:SAM-dependent methyltransferase [Nitrosomonas aestuarii]SFK95250.1 Spermine/spermidine synthase [Nitrosomonas aestuarii]
MKLKAPVYSIAMLSSAMLAYEILLMRLFSIIQWHHFAYMIISLALLGFGASGTFVSIFQTAFSKRFTAVFLINIILFSVSSLSCFLLAQSTPFNPDEILWDRLQSLRLLGIYLLLALPFFFAANAIALALTCFHQSIARIYAFDLFGAGLGCFSIVLLLFITMPLQALLIIGCMGLTAAALAAWELKAERLGWILGALILLGSGMAVIDSRSQLKLSPYKELTQMLRIHGTDVVSEHSSPLGLLSVLQNHAIPLRHAPGLSLSATGEPPEQTGVFTDGGSMTAITRETGNPADYAYLDQVTSAAPYHLFQPEHVLILGAGGGSNILQARYHSTHQIDAVELNPQLIRLMREDYADFTGNLLNTENITIYQGEARGFISATGKQYDLIEIALLDSFAASSAGLYALNESYLYTVEALQTMLKRLQPDGYLVITRWIKLPPRDSLKLFATAVDALKESGVENPGQQLMFLRSWQTGTLLIKNGPVTVDEINALKAFASTRAFDLDWHPDIQPDETNRFNRLAESYFYQAAEAILGDERAAFFDQYKFDLQPATDDRPYFFHFFKWSVLPEILSLRESGGLSLLDGGYLVLVATLAQAIVTSIILILFPLFFTAKQAPPTNAISKGHVITYFSAVGLAFLFIEIAFIQKFILFLHHPLYAVALVLAAFLVFAGLGSSFSWKLLKSYSYQRAIALSLTGIIMLGLLYMLFLQSIFAFFMASAIILKIPLTILLIAPLAFFMGMPFPLALAKLSAAAPGLIPWAWGINGCASVVSAVLATLLAIAIGFNAVILLALLLYGVAWLSFPVKHGAKNASLTK